MRESSVALTVALILTAFAGPAAAGPWAGAERTVTLREAVTIRGDVIRLGDLFVDAGDKADIRIGHGMAPGRRMVLDARMLYRLAQAHGLDWRPQSVHDHAVVERESIVIGGEEIERHILAALADRGVDPQRAAIELGDPGLQLHLSADGEPGMAVQNVAYDPRSRRFTAILTAASGDRGTQPFRVSGRLHDMTDVPVLVRRVVRGEIVSASDVEWQRMQTERLTTDTVLDASGLVGLTPKRTMAPGVPIRSSDLKRPAIVTKGGLVTLVLTRPGMELTARGRALEDGGEGDTIRIVNGRSQAVVEGVVTAVGRVTISLPQTHSTN
ncbi:MAG: flagellar basal body P-ring formation chaperone FlgA [Rhodospirillales bacterium]